MNFKVSPGVYPTMITPYKNGEINYEAVKKLVKWYWDKGCEGVFAACQSSEIMYLSLEERIQLVRTVVETAKELATLDKSRQPLVVVASGHVCDDFNKQVEELNAIIKEGPDALILISNRMNIENTSDEDWIKDAERIIDKLPKDMPLGIYECPKPYKRLMSEKMLKWCIDTKRFYFMKDTCCDASLMAQRLKLCRGSNLHLFNANAQTLLSSLNNGASGYSGVMANFHPELYISLIKTKDELIQDYIGLTASLENLTYPCCAKYYLSKYEDIEMDIDARSNDVNKFTDYQKSCIDQFAQLDSYIKKTLLNSKH